MRRISLVLILVLLPIAVFAAPPASVPFVLRPGAVIDAARGTAYAAKPNGTIDAVDLAGGRTLWTSTDAAVPLGADDLVVAQVEEKPQPTQRFLVAVLDAASGRKLIDATVTLPAGVQALVADDKDKSFRATAERDGATFLISWFYQEMEERGIPPKFGEQIIHLFAGSARLSTQTGKIIAADGGPVTGVPGRWQRYATPPAPPWQSGGVSARPVGGRGGPLTLKKNDAASGAALPDQQLSAQALFAAPSFDQRHVLASERVGQGGPDDPEYRWVIFAIDTGARVTELRRDVSAAPFFVFGDSVVFESRAHGYLRGSVSVNEPLQIQAVRLSTGVPKWSVDLRDLSYQGTRPPAR